LIINSSFGFIFVHVPKAAGTTITNIISRASCYCDIEVGGTTLGEAIQPFYKNRFGLAKHSTAREIRAVVGDVAWKRSFTFAFVRNPYARTLSTFKFMKRVREDRKLTVLEPLDRLDTFEDFVRSDFFATEGMDRILMPQTFWLRTSQKDSSVILDFVGRVEAMTASLQSIAEALPAARKFLTIDEIPHLNQSSGTTIAADAEMQWLADPDIESRVYERYKADFDELGYERHDLALRS
jgi:hypothetical protein